MRSCVAGMPSSRERSGETSEMKQVRMAFVRRLRSLLNRTAQPTRGSATAPAKSELKPAEAELRNQVRGLRHLQIVAGSHLKLEAPVVITRPTVFKKNTRIGAFTTVNGGFIDHCRAIGRYCSIGQDVRIGEPNHPIDWISTSTFQYNGRRYGWHPSADSYHPTDPKVRGQHFSGGAVEVGHDVWLGARVSLLRDVTIGHGAIVAGGAVVHKDVPPYAIVGGIPAKVIRYRFDEETIARLLAARWWEYSPNQLDGIDFSDVDAALERIESMRAQDIRPEQLKTITYPKRSQ